MGLGKEGEVCFRQPEYAELLMDGFSMFDMHVHTRYSDTFTRIRSILRRCKRLGIGIAITDHNEIEGVKRAISLESDVPIIPGIEVSTKEGPHILLYFKRLRDLEDFFSKIRDERGKLPYMSTNTSIYEVLRLSKAYDCLSSLAHPNAPGFLNYGRNVRKGILEKSILEEVEALEVINGISRDRMNHESLRLAEMQGKSVTAGSDAHTLMQVGSVVTCAKACNIRDFITRIKAGKSLVVGQSLENYKFFPYMLKCFPKHMMHPLIKGQDYFEGFFRKKLRYHKPKAIEKVSSVKSKSVRAIRDPVRAAKRARAEMKYLGKRTFRR